MIFLILLLLLIFINAYFSAVEIAMVSVRKFRIQKEADSGNKKATQVLNFLKKPDEYLSSIQVGITLVGIIEGLYGGEILQKYLEPKFLLWGLIPWWAHILSIVLGVGLITLQQIITKLFLSYSFCMRLNHAAMYQPINHISAQSKILFPGQVLSLWLQLPRNFFELRHS